VVVRVRKGSRIKKYIKINFRYKPNYKKKEFKQEHLRVSGDVISSFRPLRRGVGSKD